MRLVGLPGSTRAASTNLVLLEAFAAAAPPGVNIAIYRDIVKLPIFNPDYEPARMPPIVSQFIDQMRQAEGIIIASPEYAHGIPGGLKNALDWLVSDTFIPLKPVMCIHASNRNHHSREHLREVLRTMSLSLFPGQEFERNLVGMKSDAAKTNLCDPISLRVITACLTNFRDFIAHGVSSNV